MASSSDLFDTYSTALVSQPLSAIGRGFGSAIFLEFGRLSPFLRRDGSLGSPKGERSIMIEWSWRIESEDAILCGSWSDEGSWGNVFGSLIGRSVETVSVFGRLPELSIALSGGFRVASFMTAEGQPAWTIFDNTNGESGTHWISVRDGKICEGS